MWMDGEGLDVKVNVGFLYLFVSYLGRILKWIKIEGFFIRCRIFICSLMQRNNEIKGY